MRRLSIGVEYEINLMNVLNDFFILGSDGWNHKRVDAEIADYRNQATKNKENGKLGGRPAKKIEPKVYEYGFLKS